MGGGGGAGRVLFSSNCKPERFNLPLNDLASESAGDGRLGLILAIRAAPIHAIKTKQNKTGVCLLN